MSMRDYAVDDYGLVLNTNHLNMLAAKICQDYSEEKWNSSVSNRCDYAEEVVEKLDLEYIGEFDGEATAIRDNGWSNWSDSICYSGDTIYFVPLSYYPNFFEAVYADISDIVNDVKNKIGKYMPDDFDYRANIRHITGTYFG